MAAFVAKMPPQLQRHQLDHKRYTHQNANPHPRIGTLKTAEMKSHPDRDEEQWNQKAIAHTMAVLLDPLLESEGQRRYHHADQKTAQDWFRSRELSERTKRSDECDNRTHATLYV